MIEEQLKKETRMVKYVLFTVIIFSCQIRDKVNIDLIQTEYVSNNFHTYNHIYKDICDTLGKWKADTLANSLQYFFDEYYKLDSMIILNSDSTRILAFHLEQKRSFLNAKTDRLSQLAGAKIKNKWYFFFGPSIHVDRASYQDSVYAPLSFAELSYLAREQLRKALYRDSDGLIKAHDDFFNIIQGKYTNDSLFELHVLDYNRRFQLGKIDKIELEEIKKEISSSIQPPEPSDTRNWFQKKFGPKKLFETKEWKEYIGNKNMGK